MSLCLRLTASHLVNPTNPLVDAFSRALPGRRQEAGPAARYRLTSTDAEFHPASRTCEGCRVEVRHRRARRSSTVATSASPRSLYATGFPAISPSGVRGAPGGRWLLRQHRRGIPAGRRLRGDRERREARRSAGAPVREVRARAEPEHCKSPPPHNTANPPRPRRRGDRVRGGGKTGDKQPDIGKKRIVLNDFRKRISPPSASASAMLSTGRSISAPSSRRRAAFSTPRCWRICSGMTPRRSPTSQQPLCRAG